MNSYTPNEDVRARNICRGRGAVIPRGRSRRNAGVARAYTDIRLQARGLVRVFAGELAKRRRYLATAVDGELHPQNVGVNLRCSRRDPESVGDLDIRVALREQVHDLTLTNGKSCLAIESQHGPAFSRV